MGFDGCVRARLLLSEGDVSVASDKHAVIGDPKERESEAPLERHFDGLVRAEGQYSRLEPSEWESGHMGESAYDLSLIKHEAHRGAHSRPPFHKYRR